MTAQRAHAGLRFAVIGDPVAQSQSPRMHAAAYAALGLDCAYDALHTAAEGVPAVLARLASGELAGLNVTVPHKERVLLHVDGIDASVGAAHVANTIVRTAEGRLVAHNTDIPALTSELEALVGAKDWHRVHALVLGTGATARSAVVSLGQHLQVARITVRGRALSDPARGEAIRSDVTHLLRAGGSSTELRFEAFAGAEATERDVRVVVQATSLGMKGAPSGTLARDAVAWRSLPDDAVALDVVYGSAPTPFLAAAESRGLRCADGRGMLARQGALAFELWMKMPAPFEAMRAALFTDSAVG